MNGITTQMDVRHCAVSVMAALNDLQGYLTTAVNPDRIALADLKMEPMGWTQHVYSQKAFDIWQGQLKLFPDDPLTLHHMAIMHHARAFDLEAGSNPSESDMDWQAAMGLWYRLHAMDSFWDTLTAKVCKDKVRQDVIKKLRTDFPQKILAIHYDIALDKETRDKRKSRAKFHIAMARNAPFEASQCAEAQRAAYNRYIQSVPDEVWHPNELREEVLSKGQRAIVEYLNFDPRCIPALEDALRLQRRIQRSRNTAWQAMDDDDPKRKALLLLEKKDAEAWRPFFDQLASQVDELEEDVREELSKWYHGRGVDLCALDLEETAIGFYEQAVHLCRPDDDQRRVYLRELVRTLAYVAREKAGKEEQGARTFCDKILARNDLTAIAYFLLAQAYLQLSLFQVATDICNEGLRVEPDFDDFEADQWARRLTELKQKIPVLKLIPAAQKAMEEGKHADALRLLNEAEEIARAVSILQEHNSIYWLRAQAHLALEHLVEAKRDSELYKGVLDKKSSTSDIQAAERLEEMIAQAGKFFHEFGCREAFNLRNQAIGLYNEAISKFSENQLLKAINLLRSALKKSADNGPQGGGWILKKDLSMVLTNVAIGMVNSAQEKYYEELKRKK